MFAKKRTAIKALLAITLALAGAFGSAFAAQVAGTIVNLSGPLLAKKANGTVKVLALKSEVEQGDTLVSERNTYAQIRFVDNSEITLKPNTTFKVETFAYDAGKPEGDSASFNLVKGGLRSITGLLGKRNREKFQLKTPTATIGIRGTTFTADYVEATPDDVAALREAFLVASTAGAGMGQVPIRPGSGGPGPGLKPGLHVAVLDGLIVLNNPAGSQMFNAGQFGYVRNLSTAPALVPANPGLQFTPPPVFSTSSPNANSGNQPKADTVDCEVR